MEILVKNVPSGTCWTSDLALNLIISVQHVAKGDTLKLKKECPDKDGAVVHALVSELPFKMTLEGQHTLAASVLYFLLCHGFDKKPYVVIKDNKEEIVFNVSDFPNLVELFYPSRK